MSADEISKLINELPNIIMYILPGYISANVYNYVLNLRGKDLKNSLMEYIVSSFLIITLTEWGYNILNYDFGLMNTTTKIIICIISFIGTYILTIILKTGVFIKVIKFFGVNRNNESNILSDLHDRDNGTWVKIYIGAEKIIYDGELAKIEHKGSYQDSFVVISNYITYGYGENSIDEDWFTEDGSSLSHVIIKVSDITRIEAVYSSVSKKIIKKNEVTMNSISNKIINCFKNKLANNRNDTTIS